MNVYSRRTWMQLASSVLPLQIVNLMRPLALQAALVALREQSKLADYAAYTQNSEVNLTGQGESARSERRSHGGAEI